MRHEVLVVGGGIAGLRAAIEAKRLGADVAVLSMVHPVRSHSVAAQGGVNAALGNADPSDSVEGHAFDTVKGADYLSDQDVVQTLCEEAPRRVLELDSWGCPFSRIPDGRIAQRPFGGADFPRTCYAADKTGHAITHTVFQQAMRLGVPFYSEKVALKLAVEGGRVVGVVAMDAASGEVESYAARAVVLATGGAGRIYARTTNSHHSTGFGAAMAFWAGAPLEDMEFVQFHPTTLWGTNILITEAARGEGGILLNARGERFMKRYVPGKMELAPRDIVARAMWTEIQEGRGFEGGYLHLDVSGLGRDRIMERLPQIWDLAFSFAGVDAAVDPIPVQPGQHYTMGGVEAGVDGRTQVLGLYAAGECACASVHGANRLGGNSLLDCLVFGARAGASAASDAKRLSYGSGRELSKTGSDAKEAIEKLREKGAKKGAPNHYAIKRSMRDTMWGHVGIFRDRSGLEEGVAELRELRELYRAHAGVSEGPASFDASLTDALMLEGMLDVSLTVAEGALRRQESRGSHYRTDYPRRDDAGWLRHTLAQYAPQGPIYGYKPVTVTKWPVRERTY